MKYLFSPQSVYLLLVFALSINASAIPADTTPRTSGLRFELEPLGEGPGAPATSHLEKRKKGPSMAQRNWNEHKRKGNQKCIDQLQEDYDAGGWDYMGGSPRPGLSPFRGLWLALWNNKGDKMNVYGQDECYFYPQDYKDWLMPYWRYVPGECQEKLGWIDGKIHSLTVYGGCCKFYSKKGCDDQSLNIATVKSMPKGITSKSWLTSQEDLLEKISAFKCVKDVTCNGL